MLDELPPYFISAKAKTVGNSDLSVVTATALSNLLVALGKEELKNVVLVITDLTASYQAGHQQIISALSDLQQETGRSAMDLEPVRMNTDEFYQILRKRIFEKLPSKEDIAEVAQAYAKSIRDARQMDVTNASPEQFAQRIVEAYPFHPAIRDLYARFKENPGFQQTRGLIRLMRIVTARIWKEERDNRYLVSAHDVDFNDRETLTEINLRDQSIKELKARLESMFEPDLGWCYQKLQVLPAVDEIDVTQDKVTLVIAEPHQSGLHPDLQAYAEQLTFRNRLCFLTGQRNFDALLSSAKELKAINQIIGELVAEGTSDQDPQLVQARDLLDRIVTQFLSATRETFTTLYFPVSDKTMNADFLMEFTENRYKGEEQVIKALKAKQKYSEDVSGDTFRMKAEQRLFTQKQMLWSEIKRRAAINPAWQWHRADALDRLKDDCVHKDQWREAGGYVDKGPFPLADTDIKIQVLTRNDDTGNCRLRVNPINADRVYVELGGVATTASQLLSGRDYETDALEVSFLAVDSTGKHNTGKAVGCRNIVTLKSRLYQAGDDKMLELRAAPPASLRYSTEGSDPKMFGATYEAPFVVPTGTRLVLAVGERNGIQSEVLRIDIDWSKKPEDEPIDKESPATWRPADGVKFDETRTTYGFMARLSKFGGEAGGLTVRILGERWVDLSLEDSIRLSGERMEKLVEHLRGVVDEGQVTIEAKSLHFSTGAKLLEYVEEVKAQLPRNEVQP